MIKHSINISPISTLTKKETSKTKSPPQASSAGNTLGLIEITAPCMHLESGHETLEASIAAFVPTSYQKTSCLILPLLFSASVNSFT